MQRARILPVLALVALVSGLPASVAAPASVAPDFNLPARDGSKVHLSDLKGQVVMINFWASWCGPCRQEMPLLQQIQAKYEPLGFTLLGVNVEPDSAEAEKWLKNVPVTFPILFDRENSVSARFGVEAMPRIEDGSRFVLEPLRSTAAVAGVWSSEKSWSSGSTSETCAPPTPCTWPIVEAI